MSSTEENVRYYEYKYLGGYRLTKARHPELPAWNLPDEEFSYDRVGNRLSAAVDRFSRPADIEYEYETPYNSNLMTEDERCEYECDPAGRAEPCQDAAYWTYRLATRQGLKQATEEYCRALKRLYDEDEGFRDCLEISGLVVDGQCAAAFSEAPEFDRLLKEHAPGFVWADQAGEQG